MRNRHNLSGTTPMMMNSLCNNAALSNSGRRAISAKSCTVHARPRSEEAMNASMGNRERPSLSPFGERADAHDERRGFTIVELLIVLVMLSIVAAMGLLRMKTTNYKSDAAAQLTRTLLQYAQRDAITRQSDVLLSVDAATNRIRMVEDYNDNNTIDASERVTWRALDEGTRFVAPPMGRVGGGALTAPYAGSALTTIAGLPGVIYRRDGSASSDFELYLALRTNVTNEYRAVILSPATGRVDIYRYTGAAWVRVTQ